VTLNGTPITRQVNNQNQIESLSNSTTDLGCDTDGNTLNDQTGQTYRYDAWYRLVKVTTPSGDTISYKYDALSRRISSTDSTTGQTTDLMRRPMQNPTRQRPLLR
jgi:YD repeat-containing protein